MEDSQMIEKIAHLEERARSNTKRLDVLEPKVEDIHDLTYSVKELATETKAMRADVNKLVARVDSIENEPYNQYKKRKEDIVKQIISFFIGIILMFLAFKFGLNKYI